MKGHRAWLALWSLSLLNNLGDLADSAWHHRIFWSWVHGGMVLVFVLLLLIEVWAAARDQDVVDMNR